MSTSQRVIDPSLYTIKEEHRDLDFAIVAVAFEYRVEYSVYDIVGYEPSQQEGEPERALYRAGESTDDMSNDLADATRYLHGIVKWDGCSDWSFDVTQDVMLHACSRADVERVGAVMVRCWDWTAKLCPKWSA